jgi:hypothetical protein
MSPALIAQLLGFFALLLREAPELIHDVEQLIADIKGGPKTVSASADAHASMDQLEAELSAPPKG